MRKHGWSVLEKSYYSNVFAHIFCQSREWSPAWQYDVARRIFFQKWSNTILVWKLIPGKFMTNGAISSAFDVKNGIRIHIIRTKKLGGISRGPFSLGELEGNLEIIVLTPIYTSWEPQWSLVSGSCCPHQPPLGKKSYSAIDFLTISANFGAQRDVLLDVADRYLMSIHLVVSQLPGRDSGIN